ncbi:MAG: gliding motility protein GldN [Bacteroidales bacterium]
MKSILVSVFIAVLFFTTATAQVLEQNEPIHLRAWAKVQDGNPGEENISNAMNRVAVQYPYLREADVMWAKRVWQELDLREKINHPLYYPAQPVRHRMSLMSSLWNAAVNEGSLTVYIDEDFKVPYTVDELKLKLTVNDTITIPNPLDPDYDTTIIVTKDFDPADVMYYWIVEDWFFDNKRSVLEKRIIGLAPMREKYTTDPNTGERILQGKELLFWVYFPHARNMLVKTEVFNRWNDTERMTFDDLFFKRMFSGRIIKADNVYDRYISEFKLGLDALLEADQMKRQFQEFEMDLWEY